MSFGGPSSGNDPTPDDDLYAMPPPDSPPPSSPSAMSSSQSASSSLSFAAAAPRVNGARFGAHAVALASYSRHMASLESLTLADVSLSASIAELQRARDEREEVKRRAKDVRAKELQAYIQEQMERRKELARADLRLRKVPSATSFYPFVEREGAGPARREEGGAGVGGAVIANPFNVPMGRKFLGIPGVAKKGVGYSVSSEELLEDLTEQMALKDTKKREEKLRKLDEEKRYIEHIALEMDFDNHTKQLEATSKKEDLLRAWEREKFLKQMQKLRMKGDIEGLITHKNTLPTLTSNNQLDSSRSKTITGVGFDSRS